jgi:serpin B
MAHQTLGAVLSYLRRLTAPEASAASDRQLLERFIDQHDETAFTALVQRHGPLVLGVCRRLLDHDQDVEDAFQAVFLVLVRRASSLPWQESIAPWLHQVAQRIALKARAVRSRRRLETLAADEVPASESETAAMPGVEHQELRQVLDEELERLPARYRAPLVLCYLQGKTHEEAAQELGWKRGSIAYRLGRAQDLLRDRLVGRGVALSASLTTLLAAERTASAAVPVALVERTGQTASLFAAGEAVAAGSIPTNVTHLAEGVIQTMHISKLKIACLTILALALLGGGTHLLWPTSQAADPGKVFKNVPLDSPQVKTDKAALIKGNNQFAFDLYGKLRTEKGNLFLSPYSISTALGMTSAGARQDTLKQMEKTLHFPVEQTQLHPAFGALVRDTCAGKGYQLSVANAAWCQLGVPFLDDFLTTNETYYKAKPTGLDFRTKTEESRQTINAWVEKQTQDKIKELLKPRQLTPATCFVLTNAIYFKGDWAEQFDKKLTKDQPFLGGAGKVTVPLMVRTGQYKYLETESFQAVELPYVNQELSMAVFLPKKTDGLSEFEKGVTAEQLAGWLDKTREQSVTVHLPRFKMTAEFNLKDTLISMGMSDAFDVVRADFTGVTGKPSDQIHLSGVVHKAFVDVNEEGTEAAAATAAVGKGGGAPRPNPVFRADHPFFFLIRDNRSGSILFAGRLVDPEKSN